MEEPIQVVIESAPLWERLLALVVPLIGGALAVMAGIWLERRRSSSLERREHLREIQDRVFRPLEQKIRRYFLPILRPVTINIELQERRTIRRDTSATDYLWERREELGVVPPDVSVLEVPSDALYNCSKRFHYQEVIQQYEALEADINSYNARCLEYIESVADHIEQITGLQKHSLAEVESPWVRAEALALHIYKRQQGFESHGVQIKRPSPDAETNIRVELPNGSGVIHKATLNQAESALELVAKLENNRDSIDQLQNTAATLWQRSVELGETLERLLHTTNLEGECDFLNK